MALAHELGHIKQIMDEYCCNISRFAKERKSDMQADVGYISLVDAINKGVSGEALADIERKYRASKFELYADNFAVEVFTNNIEYYTRNIRINCAG